MSNGFEERCLCCGREISEFEDKEYFMCCPQAHGEADVILSLMPKFDTEDKMKEAITILEKGGYEMSATDYDGNGAFYPNIPIIRNLARRLMRYESIAGVWHHDFYMICKECVVKLSRCGECEESHPPRCPVCKAELISL
jgi:hypothetical protein